MKMHRLLLLLLCGSSLQLAAQTATSSDALIGTWKETTDSLEETKIISPTHVFFYVRNTKEDTMAYSGAGTYTTKGDKYTEHLQYANFKLKDSKPEFTFKVQGGLLKQQGKVVFADGTIANVNHTFTKVQGDKMNNGSHVGTWNQLSSSFTMPDGTKESHTNATHIRYQIITPTHWMRISLQNNQFENAFGGTYTMDGNKMVAKIDYGSMPGMKGAIVDITQRVEGNKLYWSGMVKDATGKQIGQFEDVFERVSVKDSNKTAAK
jgi:hypothetical protein